MDLGEVNQADAAFKQCVSKAPAAVQRAFMNCDITANSRLVTYARTLNLDVFYELYHLSVRDGAASYLAQYTILPRDYVLGFDYHVTRGSAPPGWIPGSTCWWSP
jgi:hypothetical protein